MNRRIPIGPYGGVGGRELTAPSYPISGTTKKYEYKTGLYSAVASNGYGLTATNQELYGTLGQGTITFVMDPDDEELSQPQCSLGQEYSDRKTCVLVSLLRAPKSFLSIDILVTVDLSRLGIDDDIDGDKKLIRRLLRLLKNEGSTLHYLYLQKNSLNRPYTIHYLEELLDERKRISLLNMCKNGLSKDLKKRLKNKVSLKHKRIVVVD